MQEDHMRQIADLMVDLLQATQSARLKNDRDISKAKVEIDARVLERVKKEVDELLRAFPLYPELDF